MFASQQYTEAIPSAVNMVLLSSSQIKTINLCIFFFFFFTTVSDYVKINKYMPILYVFFNDCIVK